MLVKIGIALVIFAFGYRVGVHSKSEKMRRQECVLTALANDVKKMNNKMVENFAYAYSMSDHEDGEFTEIDAVLFDMWMD